MYLFVLLSAVVCCLVDGDEPRYLKIELKYPKVLPKKAQQKTGLEPRITLPSNYREFQEQTHPWQLRIGTERTESCTDLSGGMFTVLVDSVFCEWTLYGSVDWNRRQKGE